MWVAYMECHYTKQTRTEQFPSREEAEAFIKEMNFSEKISVEIFKKAEKLVEEGKAINDDN